jgi:hypothetical protein
LLAEAVEEGLLADRTALDAECMAAEAVEVKAEAVEAKAGEVDPEEAVDSEPEVVVMGAEDRHPLKGNGSKLMVSFCKGAACLETS